jgi:hypothetical protein
LDSTVQSDKICPIVVNRADDAGKANVRGSLQLSIKRHLPPHNATLRFDALLVFNGRARTVFGPHPNSPLDSSLEV